MQEVKKIKRFIFLFASFLIFSLAAFCEDFYWESPVSITTSDSRFPVAVTGKNSSLVIWEEVDTTKKQFYLSCRIYNSLNSFSDNLRFAGPYSYSSDEVPESFTACSNEKGQICIAVMAGPSRIEALYSDNDGASFTKSTLQTANEIIAPRVFSASDNKFMMFTSFGKEDSFTIYYSQSGDGISWSKFSQFTPSQNFRNPFVPSLVSFENIDIVAFQSQYTSNITNRLSYQIYITLKEKNGKWKTPVMVTDSKSLISKGTKEFYEYQNQRPYLYKKDSSVYLLWERTESTNASIYLADVTGFINSLISSEENSISSAADFFASGLSSANISIVAENGNSSRAIPFEYNSALCVTWFDTRRGKESVYFASQKGAYWQESALAVNNNSNMFPYPLILQEKAEESFENNSKVLTFAYQQTTPNNKNSISFLSPDKTVLPPKIIPLSYKKGKSSAAKNVRYQIQFPNDSSNIAGYSYTWEKSRASEPQKLLQNFTSTDKISVKAEEGGEYYFSVRVQDYAGNWSESVSEVYNLDLTPPEPPQITLNNLDSYGFVKSNNFNMLWEPSVSEDAVSYYYKLEYTGSVPKNICVSKNHPMALGTSQVIAIKEGLEQKYEKTLAKAVNLESQVRNGTASSTNRLNSRNYANLQNGVYIFSVAAVDECGNIGDANSVLLILNKYQPATVISSIEKTKGNSSTVLSISGSGFTYDGTISEIYIDQDGAAPYDLVLKKENGDFKVNSDTKISSINIGNNLDEGNYRIGVFHTDRGLYFTNTAIKIERNGNLKIESDYVPQKKVHLISIESRKLNVLIIILLIILSGVIIVFYMHNLFFNHRENKITLREINAFWKGDAMPLKNKNKKFKIQPTLKIKLMSYIYVLIVAVVAAVTYENGSKVIQLQSQTMAASLQNRAEVLLESLCSGVKNFFPSNNILELTALPSQKDAMSEVKYVTIIGQSQDSSDVKNLSYVWATNDDDISSKTDSYTLSYGESKLTDETILSIIQKYEALDKKIAEAEKENSDNIDSLTKQAESLYQTGLKEDEQMAEQLSEVLIELRNRLDTELRTFSDSEVGSWPPFNTESLDKENSDYIFYKPVIYRKGTSDNYIHGLVYLELSTKTLLESMDKEFRKILIFSIVVAVIALHLGILFAYIFASLIVRPLKKLEKHVLLVGHTKNKVLLKGKDIKVKSKDEVGRLCNAVNEMTRELVANAEEEELIMDGKAVQKAFLPLLDANYNSKQTVAEYNDSKIQCYGYYEGESGVSGDYFDYKKLDDKWYGIIKCDASGHGIPAAIIMTVVATIFRRYFNDWKYEKNGTKLNILVEQINDFIENLGLKGKFATLIICLLNSKTGELYMCNAGDNLVHVYDSQTKQLNTITLKSAPTAGVFTSDLVHMRGGFAVEKTILKKGDVLFLYTDGIEEATRRLRDENYNVILEDVEVRKVNPKTHEEEIELKQEDAKEEFGYERIKNIIESVFTQKKYTLKKENNPSKNEVLEFDFTKCEGSIEDSILALASAEKVFRLYINENASENSYVQIDKKIDEFLNKYFNMYDKYSAKKTEVQNNQNYIDYDLVQEDEQSDDLTLLAIKML